MTFETPFKSEPVQRDLVPIALSYGFPNLFFSESWDYPTIKVANYLEPVKVSFPDIKTLYIQSALDVKGLWVEKSSYKTCLKFIWELMNIPGKLKRQVYIMSLSDMLINWNSSFNDKAERADKINDMIESADVFYIPDLGNIELNPALQIFLYSIIDKRVKSGMPLIISSDKSPSENVDNIGINMSRMLNDIVSRVELI